MPPELPRILTQNAITRTIHNIYLDNHLAHGAVIQGGLPSIQEDSINDKDNGLTRKHINMSGT